VGEEPGHPGEEIRIRFSAAKTVLAGYSAHYLSGAHARLKGSRVNMANYLIMNKLYLFSGSRDSGGIPAIIGHRNGSQKLFLQHPSLPPFLALRARSPTPPSLCRIFLRKLLIYARLRDRVYLPRGGFCKQ
jgi:hypothetical protein